MLFSCSRKKKESLVELKSSKIILYGSYNEVFELYDEFCDLDIYFMDYMCHLRIIRTI